MVVSMVCVRGTGEVGNKLCRCCTEEVKSY